MTAKQRDELLTEIDKKVTAIKIKLEGNGVKGAFDRIDDLETWVKSRPGVCPAKPLNQGDVLKRRMLEVSIMGLIIGIFEFVIGKMI